MTDSAGFQRDADHVYFRQCTVLGPVVTRILLMVAVLLIPGLASSVQIDRPITDVAGVLTSTAVDPLEAQLKTHFESTGVQLAVLVIPSTHGVPIEDYALQLAEEWGGGVAELDSGLLFVLAIEDRRMRVEVGYGLEGLISDSRAAYWIDEIKDSLRAKDYDGAVATMVRGLMSDTAGVTREALADGTLRAPLPVQAMAVYLVALGLLFSAFIRRKVPSLKRKWTWIGVLFAVFVLAGGSAGLGIACAMLVYLGIAYLCSCAFWPHWGIPEKEEQDEALLNASLLERIYACSALFSVFLVAAIDADSAAVWHSSFDVISELGGVLSLTFGFTIFLSAILLVMVKFGSGSGGTTISSSGWSSSSSSGWSGGGGYSGGGGSFGGGGASGSW